MASPVIQLFKDTGLEWYEDEVPRKAASLAYYTLLSTAPLVLFSVAIAGLLFGEEAARGQVAGQISSVVGEQAATAIQNVARSAHQSDSGTLGSIVGIVVLLVGASGVFGELQTALNEIWGVKPKPGRGIWGFLRDRFWSFTMVLGVAFMLLVSLVISTALAALGRYLSGSLPGGEALWQILNFLISLGIITGLFGLIFKVVPDAEIRWRDVWVGALFTAVLFTLGKFGLGLYLGKSTVASSYGAAGSIVALVVWVYYAAQIAFLGAEFTQVYARLFGKDIQPSPQAMPIDKPAAAAR
ncbi:MAG TPA: YihY/virulence factor BrkB family protein [Polyangiales bacterium]|nr:YihY/virulence factor BrkB family protein [Polyangiales bacterium]